MSVEATSSRPTTLVRGLGPMDGTAIIVGGIIGTGIFVSPSLIAQTTGAPGLSMLVWVVAGLLALCGGLSYAELSAAIPETGGTYAYIRRAYRSRFLAFCFGWTFFFVDGPGAIAAVATVFTAYAAYFVPAISPEHPMQARLVAVGSIALLTGVNILGVRVGGGLQRILTVLKVAALLALIAIALTATAPAGSLLPMAPPTAGLADSLRAIGAALVPALFAFGGWTYTSYVAGEMKNAERNIPLSIVVGVLVVLLIYLGVNAALFYLMPFDAVRQSPHVVSDAMRGVLGERGAAFVALAVMLSALGALNAVVLSYARIAWAMAQDGLFFASMARVHPRFRSPVNAIVMQGVIAILFALSGGFDEILGYFSFIEYLFFSLGVASLIVLRVTEPDLPRPVRVWLYPIPPILFLLVSAAYLGQLLLHRFRGSMVGVLLLLAGVPFYLYWSRRPSQPIPPAHNG